MLKLHDPEKRNYQRVAAVGRHVRSRSTQLTTTTEDMPPDPLTIEFRRCLAAGETMTDIAKRLHMGWNTVKKIIDGERSASTAENTFYFSSDETFHAKPVRCPTCAGLIHVTPCRLCAALKGRESHARIIA